MNDNNNDFLIFEIWHYVKKYRRWWLVPLVVVFALLGLMLFIGQAVPIVSPFIYTIF